MENNNGLTAVLREKHLVELAIGRVDNPGSETIKMVELAVGKGPEEALGMGAAHFEKTTAGIELTNSALRLDRQAIGVRGRRDLVLAPSFMICQGRMPRETPATWR
jgi:hypothetical protein